ncbi:MAG: calcium/sodium antiporter [Rubellimicrobium sp.]|nr:calcium/sodium antiporter [Rubellimicrobium sp.]
MDWIMVAAGLVLLVSGGEALVRGAVNLALKLGIPALIVGMTVVAFGTSAPELLVSVNAALKGQAGIALGNVVGSNIANILLILGVPAVISIVRSSGSDLRRSYWTLLLASVVFIALCFVGPLTWWHGLILIAGLAWMIADNVRQARAHRAIAEKVELEGADPAIPGWKIAVFIVAGIAALGFGADLLVEGASNIAMRYGVSPEVIGLTLVAVGTSLPELVTTVAAALKREADVAMGNVIGSGLFNLLAIIGITALIAPLEVPASMLTVNLWVMLAATLLLAPFALWRRDIGRGTGAAFLALYATYMIWLIT